MLKSPKTIAIGLALLTGATVLAQMAQGAFYTPDPSGPLLTDPSRLARGHYEFIATGAEQFYDPAMPARQDTGVYLSSEEHHTECTREQAVASSDQCQSIGGTSCKWVTVGRQWWQPDALGYYYDTDYQSGRCAELRIVNEGGALKSYFRGALRATGKVGGEPSVQGSWKVSWTLHWLDGNNNLIDTQAAYQPVTLPSGAACVPDARDVTLQQDFANCVWGAASFSPAANLTAWKEAYKNDPVNRPTLDSVRGFKLSGHLAQTLIDGESAGSSYDPTLDCQLCLS